MDNSEALKNKTMKLKQTTLRSYITNHKSLNCKPTSNLNSTKESDSTTPKSSKFCGGSRVPFLNENNKNILLTNDSGITNVISCVRKRPADVFLQSKFAGINENNNNKSSSSSDNDSFSNEVPVNNSNLLLENDDSMSRKRRHDRTMFDHGNDKEIPVSVRSLQRVQSLSMLEKSGTVSALSPDYFAHYSLRTIDKPHSALHCAFGSISGETIRQLLISLTSEQFCRKFFLVDCRYPFEYDGGHIKNAVNIYNIDDVQSVFYPSDPNKFKEINSKIPIFYCEFSQKRGPSMALELRRQDRARNEYKYPNVDYKEVYVIDQGYQKFFSEKLHFDLCEPKDYVPMLHVSYMTELKRYRSHLHDHSQAKIRRHPLFQFIGNANNKKANSTNVLLPTVPELVTSDFIESAKKNRTRLTESLSSTSSVSSGRNSPMCGLNINGMSVEDHESLSEDNDTISSNHSEGRKKSLVPRRSKGLVNFDGNAMSAISE